ncbi:hypothetical protein CPS_0928 [Colwellia psychrerythraea 34H]|uniref:Uncharacterized protein n=1 Tax=Colwellia psychrerythraea (strain 34H / ATCC BAA-681) TaxID=167879 RepID=Q487T8_COLP3|nr:hypothetical protein CPS_0928 [Colwellia psychrerythraea 34H]
MSNMFIYHSFNYSVNRQLQHYLFSVLLGSQGLFSLSVLNFHFYLLLHQHGIINNIFSTKELISITVFMKISVSVVITLTTRVAWV